MAGTTLVSRSAFLQGCGDFFNKGDSCGGVSRTSMTVTLAPKKEAVKKSSKSDDRSETVRVGVLGASGYTGSEVVRLLATHPVFKVTMMTADRKAGQSLGCVFPHLITQDLPDMVAVKDADFSKVDAVFCCLPHGTTQEIIAALPKDLKVVDLSADFRLRNTDTYEEWYNGPHRAPELQTEAVYGLTQIYREEVRAARLVTNPGCYPTSIQLPLIPLLKRRRILSSMQTSVSVVQVAVQRKLTCIPRFVRVFMLRNHETSPCT